tara:strand:- start:21586 stop:21957 length:372 start_codon:yes stop_codon:yes gene_type:complete
MKNTLHLNLRKQWFEMIFLGIKKEEYREMSNYWCSRLGHSYDNESSNWIDGIWYGPHKCFDTITFSNGYSRDRPRFEIEFKGIEIREGNPEWGAEPGKKYFVLKIGEILSSLNCDEFILKNIE